jgi:hypothetical protein
VINKHCKAIIKTDIMQFGLLKLHVVSISHWNELELSKASDGLLRAAHADSPK